MSRVVGERAKELGRKILCDWCGEEFSLIYEVEVLEKKDHHAETFFYDLCGMDKDNALELHSDKMESYHQKCREAGNFDDDRAYDLWKETWC